jgi:Cu/Zn superoxide dismutase
MLMAEAIFEKKYSSVGIKGTITFTQTHTDFVRVDINLQNVPKGIHGIHIHQRPINFKLDKSKWCDSAKAHFNGGQPLWSIDNFRGTPHGCFRLNTPRHIGDLCNNIISQRKDGIVEMVYHDNLISLIPEDPNCITGKSVIIHQNRDDEGLYSSYFDMDNSLEIESKISGNAGHRIACSNIYRI